MKSARVSKVSSTLSVAGAVVSFLGLILILQKRLHLSELTVGSVAVLISFLAGIFSTYLASFARKFEGAPRVFLSYSHESEAVAKQVAEALRAYGARVWMDVERLKAGDEIRTAVEKAIMDADAFVVLLSGDQTSFGQYELGLARAKGLRIIPVVTADVPVPADLRDIRYIDLRRDFKAGLRELVRATI